MLVYRLLSLFIAYYLCLSPTISELKGFSVCSWETDVYLRLIYADHVSSMWTVSRLYAVLYAGCLAIHW